MGRINLIIVTLVILVVGTSFNSLRRNMVITSDMINEYYYDFRSENLGGFALNYGIQKLEMGEVIVGSNPVTKVTPNFQLGIGSVDSIQFIPGGGDTITVIPYVSYNTGTGNIYHQSRAVIDFHIVQPDDQFGYYMFDDGEGLTVSDSSGLGFDGTMVNMDTTDWVTGQEGYALDFDGTNDYVELGQGIAEQYSDKITLTTWAKVDHSFLDWGNLVTERKDVAGWPAPIFTLRAFVADLFFFGWVKYAFDIYTTDGMYEVQIWKWSFEMDLWDWHFIAGIYDQEAQTISIGIVDEDEWVTKSIGETQLWGKDSTDYINIGGRDAYWSLIGALSSIDGKLDGTRTIGTVLSVAQINQLMLHNGIKKPKLVEWRL